MAQSKKVEPDVLRNAIEFGRWRLGATPGFFRKNLKLQGQRPFQSLSLIWLNIRDGDIALETPLGMLRFKQSELFITRDGVDAFSVRLSRSLGRDELTISKEVPS